MLLSLLTAAAVAQLQPLPPNLIALDSDEGRKLLVESNASADFYALISSFETQRSGSYCGVASSVMILNAMPIEAPLLKDLAPFRAFTEDNVFNDAAKVGCSPESVAKGGMTVDQVAHLLRSNGVEPTAHFANESSLDEFRTLASQNVGTRGDYVLIDFFRGELGQDVGAHWSPLAAYHEGSDRFLVLDVARFRYPPYWATAADLFKAMNTTDLDSGKSRGYVLATPAKGTPGRAAVPSLAHRMVPMAIGAASAVFLLGGVIGLLIGRRLGRQKS